MERRTNGKWLWRATVANYHCDLCTLSKCVFLSAFHKFSPSVIHKMQTNKFAINCALGEKAIFHRVKGNTHSNSNNNTTATEGTTATATTTSITITSTLFSSQRDIFLLADLMSA